MESAFFKSVFRNISDGVLCIDMNGAVVLINESAEMLLRDTNHSLKGTSISDFAEVFEYDFQKKPGELVHKILNSEDNTDLGIKDIVIAPKNVDREIHGIAVPVREAGKIHGLALIFSDNWQKTDHIERYKRIADEEVLGKFAHDVGHHFNNILMAIWSNLNLVKMDMTDTEQGKDQDQINEYIRDIDNQIKRASQLSQVLLQFSETGKLVETFKTLKDLLENYIPMYVRDHNIKSEFDIQNDLWSLEMDKVQLAHVLHNIIENSVDAIVEDGLILVSAHNVELEKQESKRLKAGKYVKITIQDNGIGIPPDLLPFVFEPFFTIKGEQGAQGLGLTIAQSLMTQNSGCIDLTSIMGEGTTVDLYVPARIGPKATEAFTEEL